MNRQPTVAVIGLGRMGRRHVQAIQSLGLPLVGLADPSIDALRAAAAEAGIPRDRLFTDAGEMLRRLRPECVVIATTAPTHCEYTCAAAEAGAEFILCEKPMAVSLAQCDLMIATCRAHGTRLAVNHQMRFMEQYTTAKATVESEQFGGLSSVTVVAGNFGLAMNGSHYFEMFRFLTGESVDSVSAWFSDTPVPNPRGPQFEDRAGSVRTTTPSGKRFYLEAASDQGHGVSVVYAGPQGRLIIDELAGRVDLVVREAEYRELPSTRYGMPALHKAWSITPADVVAPTRAVLEALLAGDDSPSGEDGRLAVATLVAAHISDDEGHREVSLTETLAAAERVFPWA